MTNPLTLFLVGAFVIIFGAMIGAMWTVGKNNAEHYCPGEKAIAIQDVYTSVKYICVRKKTIHSTTHGVTKRPKGILS